MTAFFILLYYPVAIVTLPYVDHENKDPRERLPDGL